MMIIEYEFHLRTIVKYKCINSLTIKDPCCYDMVFVKYQSFKSVVHKIFVLFEQGHKC